MGLNKLDDNDIYQSMVYMCAYFMSHTKIATIRKKLNSPIFMGARTPCYKE